MDGNWSPWITSLANWVSSQYSPSNSGRQPSPLSGLPGFGYPQAGPTIGTTAPPVQPPQPAAPKPATPLWLQMGQMPAYDPTGGMGAAAPTTQPAPRPRPVMPPLPQPRPPEAAMAAAPASPQGWPADPNAVPTFGQFLSSLGSIPGRFTQDLLGTTSGPSLIDSLLAKLKGASFGSASGGGLYPMGQDQ